MITAVGFDGDDTLWHMENTYSETEIAYQRILALYACADQIKQRLFATEMKNLTIYGYGVKSFILSMLETALSISSKKITAHEIEEILEIGRSMLERPVEQIEGVDEILRDLSGRFRLLLITKGDLFDQEKKLAHLNLGPMFHHIEIVSSKDEVTYANILERHNVSLSEFVMVGNSVRSDVLPVIALGGRAVHVPYSTTWAHEDGSSSELSPEAFREVRDIRDVPAAIVSFDD